MTDPERRSECVGSRVEVDRFFGTIRYFGPIDGKPGNWYGIEWDIPNRGKNSGNVGSNQYFSVSIPGSGSFISSTSSLIRLGRPIEEALHEKYISDPIADTTITFGGNSSILVQTVGWENIQQKQKKHGSIVEMGLAGMQITHVDAPDRLSQEFYSVKDLDLSRNLFRSWEEISKITLNLPTLSLLRLSFNRLSVPCPPPSAASFDHIQVLVIMHSSLIGDQVLEFLSWFKSLKELHVGNNRICSFSNLPNQHIPQQLQVLNLEQNQISSWSDLSIFFNCPNLRVMNLAGNNISSLPKDAVVNSFRSLEKLNFTHNPIPSWKDVHAFNSLESLVDLRLNVLALNTRYNRSDVRDVLIAKLNKIHYLNGSAISRRDRLNAELWYLRTVCAPDIIELSPAEFAETHPNYVYLCKLHGKPETVIAKKVSSALGDRLALCCIKAVELDTLIEKRFPVSIKVGVFKLTICKLLRCSILDISAVTVISKARPGENQRFDLTDDVKTLEEYGLVPAHPVQVSIHT